MKNLLIIFFLSSMSIDSWSQDHLIRIQMIGFGATETQAIEEAQINALKRSYQTFLSSDLTVLNNQIVKDEIASLVSGTINNFRVISTFKGDMGLWEANIDATLSQDSLINFAKGIGDEITVQGSLYVAEINQQNLNRDNEFVSIKHLIKKARFYDDFYDIELSDDIDMKEFDKSSNNSLWQSSFGARVSANENFLQLYKLVENTLDVISMSSIETEKYHELGRDIFSFRMCANPRYYVFAEPDSVSNQTTLRRYGERLIYYTDGTGLNLVDKSKRKNRKEKKRARLECKDYFLRDSQSIITLYQLEEIVREDLEDYAIYYIDPSISDELSNRPGILLKGSSSGSTSGMSITFERKYHPLKDKPDKFMSSTNDYVKDLSKKDIRNITTICIGNSRVPGFLGANSYERTIYTHPCDYLPKGTYTSADRSELGGMDLLIFPAKNDLILELVISHKTNLDKLSSLTGFKTSAASEVRKRKEQRQQRKELEDKRKEQRRLKLEAEKLETERIKKSEIRKIDQAENENKSFLDRITDIFK